MRAPCGLSLLLLLGCARSCHRDVWPRVFSTMGAAPWSPGSLSASVFWEVWMQLLTLITKYICWQTHTFRTQQDCLFVHLCFFFFYFLSGAVCFLYVFFLTGAAVGDILSFSTCALSFYCQCFTEISFPLSLKGSYNCWVFSLYYCRVFIVQYTILILMRLLLWFGTTSINLNWM